MNVYRLVTNENVYFVTEQPTEEQQMAYVKAKLRQGLSLSQIMFSWGRVRLYTVQEAIESI